LRFIGSHLVREQTQLVKTYCEEIQPLVKSVGVKSWLLLRKKKDLWFYPQRKQL